MKNNESSSPCTQITRHRQNYYFIMSYYWTPWHTQIFQQICNVKSRSKSVQGRNIFQVSVQKESELLMYNIRNSMNRICYAVISGHPGGLTPGTYGGIARDLLTFVANFWPGMGTLDRIWVVMYVVFKPDYCRVSVELGRGKSLICITVESMRWPAD